MQNTTDAVDLVEDATVTNLARAVLFAALVGAFAYVSIPNPLSPAPITLQVLGYFLAGILLGPVWGAAAMVLYLTAGAIGVPVFAGGGAGLGILLGPTTGYLVAAPIAVFVVGWLAHGGRSVRPPASISVPRLVGAMVVGTVVIYALGLVGMMLVLQLGPVEAFLVGAAAFIPAELVKIAAAVGIVHSDAIAAA